MQDSHNEGITKVIILGATGGCVDILDTIYDINAGLSQPKYDCLGFLDDKHSLKGTKILGAPLLGPFGSAMEYPSDCFFVTGIGSTLNFWKNKDIIDSLGIPRERFATIVHPTAVISSSAQIGVGSVIYQNVCITTKALVGDHVLVLPNTVISHDVIIGDHCRITAGVSISGAVTIGKSCYIGSNTSIRNDVTIGDYSLIGMGSVVLEDIAENSVAFGSPAKVVRNTRPA